MKPMTAEAVAAVLAAHQKWLDGEEGGERANLRGAIQRGADLRGADLRGADLEDAILRGADLRGADLRGADLRGADLEDAILRRADLRGADLRGVDLEDAILRRADLERADLEDAILRGADLRGADLERANLRGAELEGLVGNLRHVKSLQTDTYHVTYTADVMQIGCQRHPIADWWGFDDRRILEMEGRRALVWWHRWKPMLQQIIELSPAEPTKPNEEEAAA